MQDPISMAPQTVHPYFSSTASEHEKQFMLKEYDSVILKYATIMNSVAPKKCERCERSLLIPELCWREAKNISNFLCYKCIGTLEKEGAEMEHDGIGRYRLIKIE